MEDILPYSISIGKIGIVHALPSDLFATGNYTILSEPGSNRNFISKKKNQKE